MSEEERKAMKYFFNLRANIDESYMLFGEELNVKCSKEMIKQISTVLNLIEKQQKEIEKKDKIIDEMAGYLAIIRDCPNEDKGANIDCENRCSADDDIKAECWKLYFERKLEEDK